MRSKVSKLIFKTIVPSVWLSEKFSLPKLLPVYESALCFQQFTNTMQYCSKTVFSLRWKNVIPNSMNCKFKHNSTNKISAKVSKRCILCSWFTWTSNRITSVGANLEVAVCFWTSVSASLSMSRSDAKHWQSLRAHFVTVQKKWRSSTF